MLHWFFNLRVCKFKLGILIMASTNDQFDAILSNPCGICRAQGTPLPCPGHGDGKSGENEDEREVTSDSERKYLSAEQTDYKNPSRWDTFEKFNQLNNVFFNDNEEIKFKSGLFFVEMNKKACHINFLYRI